MDKNLLLAVSTLSRLALPLTIEGETIGIEGTSIILTCIDNEVYMECKSLPSLCLEFREHGFNTDLFIHRVHQALYSELDIVTDVVMQGIYNTAKTVGMKVDNIIIENEKTGNTIIILPIGNDISVVTFNGPVVNCNIKSTMVLPLANDPLRYINIIRSIS